MLQSLQEGRLRSDSATLDVQGLPRALRCLVYAARNYEFKSLEMLREQVLIVCANFSRSLSLVIRVFEYIQCDRIEMQIGF